MQEMAETGTTAQVHPQKLTAAFMEAAQANGAKLVRGSVLGINVDKGSNSVTGGLPIPFACYLPFSAGVLVAGAVRDFPCCSPLASSHPS